MRTVIIYKPNTDSERQVLDFLHDFKKQTGHDLETIDPQTAAGTTFCEAYDIVDYPTVLALADNNTMQQMWVGLPLPTIMEVSYYV